MGRLRRLLVASFCRCSWSASSVWPSQFLVLSRYMGCPQYWHGVPSLWLWMSRLRACWCVCPYPRWVVFCFLLSSRWVAVVPSFCASWSAMTTALCCPALHPIAMCWGFVSLICCSACWMCWWVCGCCSSQVLTCGFLPVSSLRPGCVPGFGRWRASRVRSAAGFEPLVNPKLVIFGGGLLMVFASPRLLFCTGGRVRTFISRVLSPLPLPVGLHPFCAPCWCAGSFVTCPRSVSGCVPGSAARHVLRCTQCWLACLPRWCSSIRRPSPCVAAWGDRVGCRELNPVVAVGEPSRHSGASPTPCGCWWPSS